MRIPSLFFAGLAAVSAFGGVVAKHNTSCSTFANRIIYTPPDGTLLLYPRVTELSDGTILATIGWRGDSPADLPYFPVFASKDGGWTWKHISNITDQVNGLGMTAQPALAELPYAIGDYPKGTVLASGNSWSNSSTNIDLYASPDKGKTWEFVSNVARGGGPNTTNGADPIWEPFILPYEGTLGMFYSDQRDPLHGQKLAHQESDDLKAWGPVVNDVAYLNYTVRPGMTVIDYIEPIDKWIFVYEYPPHGGDLNWFSNEYPVHYKMVSDPFDFRYADGWPIVTENEAPNASPYVVWSSSGGANGTLIVSDADFQEVFTNQYVGRVDKWVKRQQPGKSAYSRALHVLKSDPDRLLIFSGAGFNDEPTDPVVPFTVTALSVSKLVADGYSNEM
ncbi:BNR/Asp-box repeat domain protein [Sarocladium implicatum]|nr:BNR/Asp-box repeat domain protein [Sarocladium implicatum]